MKAVKHIIGTIFATIGLFAVFICGGAESAAMCALVGGCGLALLMIGGGMLTEHEEEDEDIENG